MILRVSLLILSFFLGSSFAASKPLEKKKKSVFIKVLKEKELFDTYTFPAKVVPTVNASVLSESQGVVGKINKGLGTKVKRGDVILKVRHTDPVFKYKPMALVAPVDGVVSKVLISEGSLVNKGQTLVMITDPLKVKVKLEVSQKDLSQIKRGLVGKMSVRGTKEPQEVSVSGISPYVDPATGTATVELDFVKDNSFGIGSLGKVTFNSNQHKGIVLPEHAIFYQGRKTYLRLLDEKNKVGKVEISLGPKRRGMVEISEGASAGMTIIERTSGFVADGAEVTVKNPVKKESAKSEEVKNKKEK